ncbi:MAG: TlpA family protein disulfide reductase [Bryobacterales bacterium]|nr:TlpA family protein disulfide reductase [Bryobacterales bacterium]
MPRFALALLLGASAAFPQGVDRIVRTLEELVPKEPVSPGIETELRAAYLLRESHSAPAQAFLERGSARLAAHPEIVPTPWMMASLFAIEPERAEEIVLQHAKPASFAPLLEYYLKRNQSADAIRIMHMAIAYDGPPLGYMGTALGKLIPLDPPGAADIYFTLRNSPALRAKYPLPAAPVQFAQGLASAAPNDRAAVHQVLERLLPLLEEPGFLTDGNSSFQVVVAGQEVRVKSGRQAVLLRIGALTSAVAPDLYQRYGKLFDERLASVKSLADALPVVNARAGPIQLFSWTPFDFEKAPLDAALAEVRKTVEVGRRVGAAGVVMGRADVSQAQKRAILNEMLASIQAAPKRDRAGAADDLIWWASKAGMDRAAIRPAVELLADSARDSSYPIDHEAALMMRKYGVYAGRSDPSIQSRIALLELEDALAKAYTFTLPLLDGKPIGLAELRGKVVLLNFWATWCGPCREEMPILENVYRQMKDKGVAVLAITDEDPSVVQRFAKEFKMGLPVVIDRTRSTFDHYAIEGLPQTVILDRQGRIAARTSVLSDEASLRKLLASAGATP